ncbi:Nonribosomal peptide synthetase 2, partial [Bienertia sinuspersici]
MVVGVCGRLRVRVVAGVSVERLEEGGGEGFGNGGWRFDCGWNWSYGFASGCGRVRSGVVVGLSGLRVSYEGWLGVRVGWVKCDGLVMGVSVVEVWCSMVGLRVGLGWHVLVWWVRGWGQWWWVRGNPNPNPTPSPTPNSSSVNGGGFKSKVEHFLYSGDKKHVFAGLVAITAVFAVP